MVCKLHRTNGLRWYIILQAAQFLIHAKGRAKAMKRTILCLAVLMLAVFSTGQVFASCSLVQGAAAEAASVSVGDTVCFGRYVQSSGCSAGEGAIAWTVLDQKDGMVLLLAATGLETGPFNSKKQRATWADCSLRQWLNNDFFCSAFTGEEQCSIAETAVSTPGGCFISPATGETITIEQSQDTQDMVFLLSVAEVEEYLPSECDRMSENNDYLLDKPESTLPFPAEGDPCDFTYGNWWLRDVRVDKGIKSAFHVKSYGTIASAGQVNLKRYVIRPAIWVDANYPFERP